nr:uncharacterized protein [uncultured bacterium]
MLSHVSTERISTISIPASSICLATSAVISWPAVMISCSFCGSYTSCNDIRPSILSESGSMMSSLSFSALVAIPRNVPQSSSVITTSCDTSTKRRVR